MSRYFFAPMPITGHVNPGLPIARELVGRGHDVRWYSTPRFKKAIEAIGARYVPFREALPLDEENVEGLFPDRPAGGLSQLQYDLKNLFVSIMPGMLRDCEEELRREPADVVVADNTSAVGEALHTKLGLPWAVYGTNGGYGSIQIALAHGVPVVAIGKTEEKPEIANRVQWSGVGLGLKVRIPSESQIRNAVSHVLNTPTYAARAEALAYELSRLDAASVGADLLEELAGEEALAQSA